MWRVCSSHIFHFQLGLHIHIKIHILLYYTISRDIQFLLDHIQWQIKFWEILILKNTISNTTSLVLFQESGCMDFLFRLSCSLVGHLIWSICLCSFRTGPLTFRVNMLDYSILFGYLLCKCKCKTCCIVSSWLLYNP